MRPRFRPVGKSGVVAWAGLQVETGKWMDGDVRAGLHVITSPTQHIHTGSKGLGRKGLEYLHHF